MQKLLNSRELQTYSPKEKNYYLIAMTGQNIFYNIIGVGLAYYLGFVILIPAVAVSIIMTSARIWDAFNDFIMGSLVDKTKTKWGKCRPYLIILPIPITIITILCFTNFGIYDGAAGATAKNVLIIFWAAFTYVLWGMTYTIADIPLWSSPALMTEKEKDRNKLLALARLFGGVGAGITFLAFMPIANAISASIGSDPVYEKTGYLIAAIGFSVIAGALFQLGGINIKERVKDNQKKYTLKENFKIMLSNKPFKQVLFSGILGSPKMIIAIAAIPLVNYYFATKDPIMALVYLVILGSGIFIGQAVGAVITPNLLKKFTKKNLYNYSHIISAPVFALIFVLYLASPRGAMAENWLLLSIMAGLFTILGLGMGITMVLQSTMIADCIDLEEFNTGKRPDGVFFAGQTFLAKLTTGIATLITGIGYTIVGFSDNNVSRLNDYISTLANDPSLPLPRNLAIYDNYMMILFFLVSIPPAIGCLLTIIPTWHYALDDEKHDEILAELNRRRHEDTYENDRINEENLSKNEEF